MIRLTAYVSGMVQRTGYRAKVVSLAEEMGLVGLVQNRPNGQVLVIAEGERNDLEKLASALLIKNAMIDVENVDERYSQGSGQYSSFKKITGPDEIGERLDDGIEVLKELVVGLNNLTVTTQNGFNQMLDKQDTTIGVLKEVKEDTSSMLEKQDTTIGVLNEVKEDTSSMLEKQDTTIGVLKEVKEDTSSMLDKQDATIGILKEVKEDTSSMLEKQDTTIGVLKEVKEDTSSMLEKQDTAIDVLKEVKGDTLSIRSDISELKKDAKDSILEKYLELRQEIAEIKATLSEIKAKVA